MINLTLVSTQIVSIDGPTSSGKNSVGFFLAQKLGYQYIDTGMFYRAGSFYLLRHKIPLEEKQKILDCFGNLNIALKDAESEKRLMLDGEDITEELHSPEVTKLVPVIAAIPEVREIMKTLQRKLGNSQNTVMSGRDIGSEIFPNANFKFFLTASVEVRAQRRFNQLKETHPELTYESVLADMIDRDKKDSERTVSPLRVPEDAVVIDNSEMNVDETVSKMLSIISNKIPD